MGVEKHKKEMTLLRQKLEQMDIKNDVKIKKLKRQIDEANADKEEAVETLNRMKGRLEKEKKMIHKEKSRNLRRRWNRCNPSLIKPTKKSIVFMKSRKISTLKTANSEISWRSPRWQLLN